MIKRRLLSYDISQLTKAFKKDFPQLVTMAEESESAALFKEALRSFVSSRIDRTVGGSNMGNVVAKRIFLLIEHDGMMVSELRQVRRYQYGRLPAVAVLGREAGGRCFAGLLYRPVPAIRIAGEAGGNRSGPFACQTADEPLADRTRSGGDRYP